ncbi:MAG: type II toxin-antitoxin system Phd/YefM family antitoxin [Acidimicrobiales bacterium]
MKTVGIRALKQNASAVVAEAAAGEPVVITDRGRAVAQLVQLPTDEVSKLEVAGRIRGRKRSFRDLGPAPRLRSGENSLSAVLEDLRRSERY